MVLAKILVEWSFKFRLINGQVGLGNKARYILKTDRTAPLLVVTEFLAQRLPHRSSQIFTECVPG